jgi:hypothetical protein
MRRYRNRLHPMVATKELTLALMETTYAIYGDVSVQNVIRLVSGPRLILKEGFADALPGAISGVQKSAAGADIGKLIQVAMVLAPVLGSLFTTAKVGGQVFKLSNFIRVHATRTMRLLLQGKKSKVYEDWMARKIKTLSKIGDTEDVIIEKLNRSFFTKLIDNVTKASHTVLGDMDPKYKVAIVAIALLLAGLPFGITQRIFRMLKKAAIFGFKAAKAAVVWLFTFIRHLLFGKSQKDIQEEEEEVKREEEFLKSLEDQEKE